MVQDSEASLKPYRVELGVQALAELESILDRLAEDAGLYTAQKWSAKLKRQAAALRDAPYRGLRVEEWDGRRRLVVAPYLIVYEVSEPDLVVVSILSMAVVTWTFCSPANPAMRATNEMTACA